jgi:hypothetical protein
MRRVAGRLAARLRHSELLRDLLRVYIHVGAVEFLRGASLEGAPLFNLSEERVSFVRANALVGADPPREISQIARVRYLDR